MSITADRLSKNYGAQKAVDGISFTVGKGEIVGFLGPNGAGKSTTMKMITGSLQPDGGGAQVCGISVAEDPDGARKKLGYLPEANPLYLDMYVREYLAFTAGLYSMKKPGARIEEIINTVGLLPEANKKLGQLSKGYKQRAGLAAALVHDPEVLILDEPTSGLDPNQIIEIREVIRSFSDNRTVLFSSHILQEVEALCDRVIIINKGKITADDSLTNLRAAAGDKAAVRVSFSAAVPEAALGSLSGVQAVRRISNGEYELHTDSPDALRKQILQLSIENNWNIVSLQNQNSSLEAIFKALTKPE